MTTRLTRRAALAATAALPFVGALAPAARAAAPMQGRGRPPFNRFKLGAFEVTTLLAATRAVPEPHKIFGLSTPNDAFEAASRAAFLPTDVAQFFFTPTLVNTGKELILFDTGLDPAGITTALEAAGYAPDQVDVVVITHMHGDHIGGLADGGFATFANARYVTGRHEYDHWAAAGNPLFDTNMKPLAEKTEFLGEGGAVVPGITALSAPGHTPGHMGYHLESGGRRLLLIADTANHYVWSLAHPDWEVKFDMDKPAAAATRRKMLGMLAADRVPFIGYHMPFPAVGFVEARGQGFHYVPASYQMMLEG
ncbi:metallo-beta-lactamase [Defluviimonas sp. 20V17]|uniref:Glyoxylase, beta-lactamase superfamily II n=1 Tax=Allgaiera indica TaxID=765699 RepID=A0AAN4UNK8_9RHOB|nr:MBL fold metallo-hydrolase [Allgaiera indica]KDB02485.1 metallo-beta-lactamase [Defluviimonas sp. 20V17]GHD98749.1 MBL fold hydrolase [Allgaiera indica]SDW07012.1 Glyoxylase, beta-lactamase superfamily II [Allgaiera indica]